MPQYNTKEYSDYLSSIARELDISPSEYKKATDSYEAVGKWLNDAEYNGIRNGISIYPQGSFELGLVTKPLKSSKKPGFDIDLVCEISLVKNSTTASNVKNIIGSRLKESEDYQRILDIEKKRCWTLNYAEKDGISFHMDILPCVKKSIEFIDQIRKYTHYTDLVETAIAITNKDDRGLYSWSTSNPLGYSQWFRIMNNPSFLAVASQARVNLFESHRGLYASIEEVPDQLIRTPLQQAIQILKRHRDLRFSGHAHEDFKPISMIITTLATLLYNNEDNVFYALKNIARKLTEYSPLIEDRASQGLGNIIKRKPDGTWLIGNPVNMDENFADRWHEDDHARARAFFEWANWVREDLIDITANPDLDSIIGLVSEKLIEGKNIRQSRANSATTSRPNIEIKPLKPYFDYHKSWKRKP